MKYLKPDNKFWPELEARLAQVDDNVRRYDQEQTRLRKLEPKKKLVHHSRLSGRFRKVA